MSNSSLDAAIAHAPLPQAWVSPTPRSKTAASMPLPSSLTRAKLLKENGRFSTVPLVRLSADDNVYIRRWQMLHAGELEPAD